MNLLCSWRLLSFTLLKMQLRLPGENLKNYNVFWGKFGQKRKAVKTRVEYECCFVLFCFVFFLTHISVFGNRTKPSSSCLICYAFSVFQFTVVFHAHRRKGLTL